MSRKSDQVYLKLEQIISPIYMETAHETLKENHPKLFLYYYIFLK